MLDSVNLFFFMLDSVNLFFFMFSGIRFETFTILYDCHFYLESTWLKLDKESWVILIYFIKGFQNFKSGKENTVSSRELRIFCIMKETVQQNVVPFFLTIFLACIKSHIKSPIVWEILASTKYSTRASTYSDILSVFFYNFSGVWWGQSF